MNNYIAFGWALFCAALSVLSVVLMSPMFPEPSDFAFLLLVLFTLNGVVTAYIITHK